jgi:hypothetical protein
MVYKIKKPDGESRLNPGEDNTKKLREIPGVSHFRKMGRSVD